MAVITITAQNFESEVINSAQPVIIDFWADWCGPCKRLSPAIEELSNETTEVKLCKVNVDEQPELAGRFGVMSIPALVVMRNGKIVNQAVGMRPKGQILALL